MGKGVEMKKVLFRAIHKDQLHILDKVIREMLIKEVGLDPAAFKAGLASGKPAAALQAGRKLGERVKVESTPTVVLDGNIKVAGESLNPENLKTVIASILASDKGKKKKKARSQLLRKTEKCFIFSANGSSLLTSERSQVCVA